MQGRVVRAELGKIQGHNIQQDVGYNLGYNLPTSGLLLFPVLTFTRGVLQPHWTAGSLSEQVISYTSMLQHRLSPMPEWFSPNFSVNKLLLSTKLIKHLPWNHTFFSFPLCSHLFCISLFHNLKALLHCIIIICSHNSHSVHIMRSSFPPCIVPSM